MDTEEAHFGVIPCEIMVKIYDKISHRDRKKARLVSRRWNQILDNYPKYFTFRAKWNHRSLKTLLNSYLHIDRLTLLNLTKRMPKNEFPEIRESVLGWRNSQTNIVNFLSGCQKSEALTITKLSLGEISQKVLRRSLTIVVWNNLAELKLCGQNSLEKCVVLLESINVPSVRELNIGFEVKYKCNSCQKQEMRLFQDLCLAMYEFIFHHTNSLKILKCSFGIYLRRKFIVPEIPNHLKESMTQQLNLKKCAVEFFGVRPIGNLVTSALFGSKLECFDLEINLKSIKRILLALQQHLAQDLNQVTDVAHLDNNLQTIFASNGSSLRNIRFKNLGIMNYSWFKHCSNLEVVEVHHSLLSPIMLGEIPTQPFGAASRTLRSVKICHFPHIDLSWFENCVKLETLDICAQALRSVNDAGHYLKKSSKMNLKELRLIIYSLEGRRMDNSRQVQQLLNLSCQTLERLTLFGNFPTISLTNVFGLRFLDITTFEKDALLNCAPINFIHLTELCMSGILVEENICLIDWVVLNLTSLENFGFLIFPDLAVLQKILSMPNIKKITFLAETEEILTKILEHCQRIPGLEFRDREFYSRNTLFVDRSIYRSQQVVTSDQPKLHI